MIVSGYLPNYSREIAEITQTGKILGVVEKTNVQIFTNKIVSLIDEEIVKQQENIFQKKTTHFINNKQLFAIFHKN